jgi:hypothetical protein
LGCSRPLNGAKTMGAPAKTPVIRPTCRAMALVSSVPTMAPTNSGKTGREHTVPDRDGESGEAENDRDLAHCARRLDEVDIGRGRSHGCPFLPRSPAPVAN